MSEPATISLDEVARLEQRIKTLALDKSYLQLILRLIGKVSAAPGLDNTIETLLRSMMEVLGGDNIILYYMIGDDIHRADVYGAQTKLDEIDDEFVRQIFDSRKPLEMEHDFGETKMMTAEFTKAYTWGFPLLDGCDLIGVIKLEKLQIAIHDLYGQLPIFFAYVASALKNEILGQIRIAAHRESVASMEHVLAIVGHELRTPLAGLRAMTEMLLIPGMRDPQQLDQFLKTMNQEVVRMGNMVNDLLDAARLNSGRAQWNWESVTLSEVANEAMASVMPLVDIQNVNLTASVHPEALTMRGDSGALCRLIVNLLSNSIKHTDTGDIQVLIRSDDVASPWVTIRIQDTGHGIPQRILSKLGEAFALNSGMVGSSNVKGTGLGIAICTSIVAAHGGTISVESCEGRGTTVTARLRADLPDAVYISGRGSLIHGRSGETIRA